MCLSVAGLPALDSKSKRLSQHQPKVVGQPLVIMPGTPCRSPGRWGPHPDSHVFSPFKKRAKVLRQRVAGHSQRHQTIKRPRGKP